MALLQVRLLSDFKLIRSGYLISSFEAQLHEGLHHLLAQLQIRQLRVGPVESRSRRLLHVALQQVLDGLVHVLGQVVPHVFGVGRRHAHMHALRFMNGAQMPPFVLLKVGTHRKDVYDLDVESHYAQLWIPKHLYTLYLSKLLSSCLRRLRD